LKKYAKGPIHWYKIASRSFWELAFDNVKMGNINFKPSVKKIMADTGTSLNMIPDTDFFKIFDLFIKDKF
jgi:spore coat protein CotF